MTVTTVAVLSGINEVLSVALWAAESPKNVSAESYIECVFENQLVELGAAGTLAAAEANEHALITAEVSAAPHRRSLGGPTSWRRHR
jgi:hypothetical protein